MPYLKVVVLETLRRHPPSHFILPRAVLKDIQMDGYDIPKDAMVNFTVVEMSRDPNVWERPMEFRPERFIQTGQQEVKFDIKGVGGIQMMPLVRGGGFAQLLMCHCFMLNILWPIWLEILNGSWEIKMRLT
ncbi:PREDICTED: cytochrome P450 [Prunus dulcis]|uniref:PREDICTED: cytochrome P450 n=1 Tax=Prunus dulcis TaxID=3755 RepID=A0A5E4EQN3_PRUDU|nr:PREDICTED: cytochrome P450 [Prunus dulcis]